MKAWLPVPPATWLFCLGLVGCGGMTEADGSGGTTSSGGATSGGNAGDGGSDTGGSDTGGTSTGGATNAGGTTSAGGTGNTEDCPAAEIPRLFPVIGPFWFGPDPGPCSAQPNDVTYEYEGGLLVSSTTGGGETYVRDAESRLIEVVSVADAASYAYDGNTVTETRSTHSVVYTLSTTGYPLRAEVLTNGSTAPTTYTYFYDDCRLSLRDAPGALADRAYEYDDQGHLMAIVDGSSSTTFAYDCW